MCFNPVGLQRSTQISRAMTGIPFLNVLHASNWENDTKLRKNKYTNNFQSMGVKLVDINNCIVFAKKNNEKKEFAYYSNLFFWDVRNNK